MTIVKDQMTIVKDYVSSKFGQLHYAHAGTGDPVLMLHQTPRSWEEYIYVLPLVGRERHAIAMDMVGFGASARPEGFFSIERLADGVCELLDALDIHRVHLVGHHTGGVVSVEVAARMPERVTSLVLSATPCMDKQQRYEARFRSPIDWVQVMPDGSHLQQLWNRRRAHYALGQDASLTRYVVDALRVVDVVEQGHVAVASYPMEERLPRVACPARIIRGVNDRNVAKDAEILAAHFGTVAHTIMDAGVAFPEQLPDEFAQHVLNFTREHAIGA